jgi:hypothetical protein
LIGRQHNRIVIACDACGRTFESDSDEWIDVWPQARREGWPVRKIGKDRSQFCGEMCASKLTDDSIRHSIECFPLRFARGAECERRPVSPIPRRTMLAGQSVVLSVRYQLRAASNAFR